MPIKQKQINSDSCNIELSVDTITQVIYFISIKMTINTSMLDMTLYRSDIDTTAKNKFYFDLSTAEAKLNSKAFSMPDAYYKGYVCNDLLTIGDYILHYIDVNMHIIQLIETSLPKDSAIAFLGHAGFSITLGESAFGDAWLDLAE